MTAPSVETVATHLNAKFTGTNRELGAPAPLTAAAADSLTFVGDVEKYTDALTAALAAGAVVLAPIGTAVSAAGSPGALILVDNPRSAFGLVVAAYFAPCVEPGVAPTARVHPTAEVHPTAHVGEFTVVRENAVIGAHVEVRDHVVIGRGVVIDEHALIKSQAVVGEEGFGIEKDADGNNFHIPHIGSVHLGKYTEVGNFTTVCSGTLAPTVVGDYTKIDDHVHIAHNCQIGRNVIITACAEISGSVIIEDEVWIGPNASVIQGLTLGKDSLLGIGAVALRSVPENEIRVGNPAKRLGDNKKS